MVFDDAHVMKAALMGAAHWHEALITLPWDTARLQSLAQSAGLRRPHGAKKKDQDGQHVLIFGSLLVVHQCLPTKILKHAHLKRWYLIIHMIEDQFFAVFSKAYLWRLTICIMTRKSHFLRSSKGEKSQFSHRGWTRGKPRGLKPINSVKPPTRLQDSRISVHQPWNYLVKGSGFFVSMSILSPKLVITGLTYHLLYKSLWFINIKHPYTEFSYI